MKNPNNAIYRNSEIENWIRNETKNTIVALESFIKLCSNNDKNEGEEIDASNYFSDEDNLMRDISTGVPPYGKEIRG